MRINAGTSRRTTLAFVALVTASCTVPLAVNAGSAAPTASKSKNCHATKTCPTTTTRPATTTTTGSTTTSAATTTSTAATTTTVRPTTTSSAPTTTTVPATTTTQPVTTTTQPTGGGTPFMGYALHGCGTSVSGSTNVVISNQSYRGCRGVSAIVISNSTNVYLHDLDFDSVSGAIFLLNVTGNIRVEDIRARNTGAGRTTNGSGQGEVIQLNNSYNGTPCAQTCTAGIRRIKSYGGDTEDVISIFRSGGIDAAHRLIIEDNHIESPLPGSADGALAWTSGSGTCINAADDDYAPGDGGHFIEVRNNTALSCGQAGIIINRGREVSEHNNIVYGAARSGSNVGMTQWSSTFCSACTGDHIDNNRIWWVKANGTAADLYLSGNAPGITTNGNTLHDSTINPADLHVVL